MTDYKTHWVCVPCRAVRKDLRREGHTPICHTCSQTMIDAGRDFHTPRKTNDQQWKKIAIMLWSGAKLDSGCGCRRFRSESTSRTYAEVKQKLRERQRKQIPLKYLKRYQPEPIS